MKVGVTATRRGWTPAQKQAFTDLIFSLDDAVDEFHHGDCVGGDAEADEIIACIEPDCRIVIHPPVDLLKFRARCIERGGNRVELEPRPPLARNHIIVIETDLLVAGPGEYTERYRGSGTWATMRFARQAGAHMVTIWPDGSEEWVGSAEIPLR